MVKTLGSYLQGITDLSSIEWSKTWLWDIRFGGGEDSVKSPPPPSPFNSWFPASDFNETSNISNTLIMSYFISQYKFLQTTSSTDIQMTVHDDVDGTIYTWLSDWFNYVYDSSDGVCTLQDAYKQLDVIKLNSKREPIIGYTYYVVPEASISEMLHSSADTKSYSLSLAVIGRLPIVKY